MEMKRNSSIELFRVLLMFGICLLHSITQGGHNQAWVANVLTPCVAGFVFISGWYGIRFSVRKLVLLWGIALWASFAFAVYSTLVAGTGILVVLWGVISDTWFLHAYVLLMLLAPLLNAAVEKLPWTAFLPFLLGVFGWGFARTLPCVGRYVPATAGLTAYSGVTLCGIYLAASLIRKNGVFQLTGAWPYWVVFCVSIVACACGAGDYNSPFALLLVIAVFRFFLNLSLNEWVGRVAVMLAPSMFFVYVMHGHKYFYHLERGSLGAIVSFLVDKFQLPIPLVWLVTAVMIFVVAVVCDIPRRWLYSKLTHK